MSGKLHEAIMNGDLALAKLLLEQGADPNEKNADGKTPLHLAVAKDEYFELVELLVEKKADLEATTTGGGHTPLMYAVHYNNIPALVFLIEKGASIDKQDRRGYLILKWANHAGFRQAAEILEKAPLRQAGKKKMAALRDTASTRQEILNQRSLRPILKH
jgi:ankyrin repeat protein